MAKYVCRRRLKHGGRWLEDGQEFPVRDNENWRPLLSMGWIERVSEETPAPAPPQPSTPRSTLPDDLSSLKKAELFDLAEELSVGNVEGTGSGGLITKADLVRAIKAHGDS